MTSPLPRYASALIDDLLTEYERVYWNALQQGLQLLGGNWYSSEALTRDDTPILEVPGLIIRSVWWGSELDPRAHLPILEYDGIRILWSNVLGWHSPDGNGWGPNEWTAWFNTTLTAITKSDVDPLD
jgi:hypothetical protein